MDPGVAIVTVVVVVAMGAAPLGGALPGSAGALLVAVVTGASWGTRAPWNGSIAAVGKVWRARGFRM